MNKSSFVKGLLNEAAFNAVLDWDEIRIGDEPISLQAAVTLTPGTVQAGLGFAAPLLG